jgi:hypothetical protein
MKRLFVSSAAETRLRHAGGSQKVANANQRCKIACKTACGRNTSDLKRPQCPSFIMATSCAVCLSRGNSISTPMLQTREYKIRESRCASPRSPIATNHAVDLIFGACILLNVGEGRKRGVTSVTWAPLALLTTYRRRLLFFHHGLSKRQWAQQKVVTLCHTQLPKHYQQVCPSWSSSQLRPRTRTNLGDWKSLAPESSPSANTLHHYLHF